MRSPQTSLRKAIAYLRRTRFIDCYNREAIRLLKQAIERCDKADFQALVARMRASCASRDEGEQ